MRYGGKTLMSLGLLVIAAWVVIGALKWPLRVALFPVVVGTLVFLMATGKLLLSLFERKEVNGKKVKDNSSSWMDQPLPTRKMLLASAWTMGFFLLILLFGFPISVPLFTFLYLKLHGKEGWGMSIGLSVSALACFYGLFVWLLSTPFPEGWVQKGLRVLGIG